MTAARNGTASTIKFFRAKTRLAAMVERDGGLNRQRAVANAMEELESVRASFLTELDRLIEELGRASSDLEKLGKLADQIITVAGTYGLEPLAGAAMGLCDLVNGVDGYVPPAEHIAVHIAAIRLLAPSALTIEDEAAEQLLLGLRQVRVARHRSL